MCARANIPEYAGLVSLICYRDKTAMKKHPVKKWEVSISELQEGIDKRFKVTRRLPDMSVAETRIFRDKKKARALFDEWLK